MMDLRKKVYRMFILGTSGGGYKSALKEGLGGIIFFTDDIQSLEQFQSLIKGIKSQSSVNNLLLSIDQEGGRVERTENIHGGKKYLSARYAYQKGENFLKSQTLEIAKELKSFGINLNFAPCIDVNTNPDNPIIGERAFSDNPDEVIKAECIVSKVYRENKIMPCVKHYPGHGDANSDSHLTLPEIDLSMDEMERVHIRPFKACAKEIEMVMVAHLHCTCFEQEKIPCSMSANAIGYLRQNLGFEGIAISDDMVMKGVNCGELTANLADIAERGIKAGLNMFIYRNSNPETIDMIEEIVTRADKDKVLREKINESYNIISQITDKFFSC